MSKFEKLDRKTQIELVREEVFVLTLEREFVPRAAKNWPLVKLLSNMFHMWRSSNDYGYRWLSRLSTVDMVKDNPEWISKFCLDNHEDIVDNISQWWSERCDRIPEYFFRRIEDEYRQEN